jgi:hypothetical protein
MNEFNNSLSNDDVFVIWRVCVIAEVHPVDITPELMFSSSKDKSKSKINLVKPKFGTIKSEAPKFNSITGFLPVLTNEFEMMVLFLFI